jgi:hypothetical protein
MTVMNVPRSSWALPRTARALRLEFKRNAVPYLLPLLAAVFYFDTIRSADGFPPVWTLRSSVIGDDMLVEFSVFAAGLAAWAGSREGRRKTRDLVGTTPRAAWARLSVALAGTLGWLLLAFLAGVAVVYIQTALQATWGGPPLWPVFVGAAGVTAVTMIGFTAGFLFPGRFTAPMAALGVTVLDLIGFREALSVTASSASSGTYALLSPSNSPPLVDTGVYYHVAPDLSMVQVLFMGGIAIALFGVLGLAPELRQLARPGRRVSRRTALAGGDGWLTRVAAVLLVACGVAASGTAFALAGTARPAATGGWEIPALHSAASDQPVPATPDCASSSGFQVCVHPAFSFYLRDVAAALNRVAAQIAGLRGAPVRAEEVASMSGGQVVWGGISGNPPVFEFTAQHVGAMIIGEFDGIQTTGGDVVAWRQTFQTALLDAFLTGTGPSLTAPSQQMGPAVVLNAAQQAVENALMTAAGSPPQHIFSEMGGKPGSGTVAALSAAAQRFGRLSVSARRAWLAAHLTALRAGTITVAQIP